MLRYVTLRFAALRYVMLCSGVGDVGPDLQLGGENYIMGVWEQSPQ